MGNIGEAEREAAVARSGVLRMGSNHELENVLAFTAACYRTFFAGLSIITGRRQVLLAKIGTDVSVTPRDQSFCTVTIQRPGEPLIVPDALADRRFAHLLPVKNQPFMRFYAGVSVVDRDGYALGALCVADREPRYDAFDATELLIRAYEVERLLRR